MYYFNALWPSPRSLGVVGMTQRKRLQMGGSHTEMAGTVEVHGEIYGKLYMLPTHLGALLLEGEGQVDGRGGLAHAALAARDGDDVGHAGQARRLVLVR